MKYFLALPLCLSLIALGSTSCQRSQAFKKDQEYYKPEGSTSYYDKANRSSASRVESMGQPKKRILVFDFWNDTPVKSEVGGFAADELRRGLFLTQRLILSPEIKTQYVTEDFLDAGHGGTQIKVAQLIREGRKLGVSVLAIGRVTKIVFRQRGDDVGLLRQKQSLAGVDVEVKLFDVSGGRELLAVSRSGDASSNSLVAVEGKNLESAQYRAELVQMAVRDAVAKLVPDVIRGVEKLAWEGRIARVVGNKVYVNAGHASGLITGDILRVLAPGDDIYDPATGAFLGRTKGQLKGTLEVVDFLGPDGSVTEIHTGGNFQENDLVQLY
ncbi:MAG: CsgG/HfaB family protein [Bdellovibrionia bacterium]